MSPAPPNTTVPLRLRPWSDLGVLLPQRFPWATWVMVIGGFLGAYFFLFAFAHPLADSRACIGHLPDPLYPVIPKDMRWAFVTHDVYYLFNAAGLVALAVRAFKGDHRSFLRWILALGLQGILRGCTIALFPLCQADVPTGTIAVPQMEQLNLLFFSVPWRTWATNDLVFSGHLGEFLLMMFATRHWPRWARFALIAFQVLQAYALLATRAHYLADLVIAIPCAFFLDRLAVSLLALWDRRPLLDAPWISRAS